MLLSNISKLINCKKIYNLKKNNLSFNHISTNSKNIEKNSLLIIENNKLFKKEFIIEAIKKGTIAVITSIFIRNIKIPQFITSDTSNSLRILLKHINKNPPKNIIGITGTNGKTSVVWFVANICFLNDVNTKTYGTLGYYKNFKKIEDSNLTTPEFEILYQKSFLNTKKNNYNFIFEVSSHGIAKNRIKDFPINIAAITNLSHDHLDFHKSFKDYKKIKYKLFYEHLDNSGTAILNSKLKDIDKLKNEIKKKKIKILTYGKNKSHVYAYYKDNILFIRIKDKSYKVGIVDYNNFELENLSCAICCCILLDIHPKKIIECVSKIKKPIGRLQEIGHLENNSKVIVDYAHTPDALKNILVSNTKNGKKPNILFGCGGDRDKTKRKLMGKIANIYAQKIYITDDNPRFEDPSTIRKNILSYCEEGLEIPSRKKAIECAINELNSNTLIIAGKGHEVNQTYKNKLIKFNDAKIAKFFIEKRKVKDKKKLKYKKKENKILDYLINNSKKIKINSQDVKKDDVFLSLKGSKSHGNNYINKQLLSKVKYIITDKIINLNIKKNSILVKKDVLNFLELVAIKKRSLYNGKVIAVTGSAGKTSTKENLKFFISKEKNVSASIKSYNNKLGVLISLINMNIKSQFSIFEIGTNNYNEISKLTSLIMPHQAIITNILPTHLENFFNTRNVAIEKSNIFNPKYNPNIELLILNNDNKDEKYIYELAKKLEIPNIITIGKKSNSTFFIKNIKKIDKKLSLVEVIIDNKLIKLKSNLSHYHQIYNQIICLSIFKYNKLNLNNFFYNSKKMKIIDGRGVEKKIKINNKTIRLIDESYNASPQTMKICIDYFKDIEINKSNNKFLILGDMQELGNNSIKYHEDIIKYALKDASTYLILYGDIFKLALSKIKIKINLNMFFSNENDLINYLCMKIRNNDMILIKGSNSSKTNKLIKVISLKESNR
jgi:murE/murF fusion protein